MLQIRDVAVSLGARTLFEGVTLSLHAGDRMALVGRNGTGKTTLLEIIAGSRRADGGDVIRTGRPVVGYLRQEIAPDSPGSILQAALAGSGDRAELARRIRELETRIGAEKDPDTLETIAHRLGTLQSRFELSGGYSLEAEARRILNGLGFPADSVDRPVSSLSGGWMMRVAMARLLLERPDVLLLDEPTNHLDLSSLLWFEAELAAFRGALLFISHDRAFINRLATSVAELDQGRLYVTRGDYDAHRLDKARRDVHRDALAANQARRIAETERFIERFRAKATKARQVQSRIRSLEKLERAAPAHREDKTAAFRFAASRRAPRRVAAFEKIDFAYDSTVIYQDFDFVIERRQKVALVGENGAGKSTLLKLLAGRLEPRRGERRLGDGVRPGYYAQHQLDILQPDATLLETLRRAAPDESETRLRTLLGTFLFSGETVEKKVAVLSGGEKARLALATLLVRPPNLLLMDEPTNHLDIPSRAILEDALRAYDGTLCFITHDRHLIGAVADRIVEITGGRITAEETSWAAYDARRRPGDTEPVPDSALSPAAAAPPRRGRDRKRRLGERRARFYDETRSLKRQITDIETRIADAEKQKADTELELSNPESFADGTRMRALQQALSAVTARIAELTARWEEASLSLEACETRFRRDEARLQAEETGTGGEAPV